MAAQEGHNEGVQEATLQRRVHGQESVEDHEQFLLELLPDGRTQVREFRGQVKPNPGEHLGLNGCRLMVRASEDTTWKHGILAIRDIQKIRGTVFWGPHNKDPTM